MAMAVHGFVLLRNQGFLGTKESGIVGQFLTGDQQCQLSECFGAGSLHSTHGVHPKSPMRDVFRLSNHPDEGFNSVGPEWHNDGSFCRKTFGHVVYHIVKAPHGAGDTVFAHLGKAYEALTPEQQERCRRCASVNSNSGVVHPLVHAHPISKRLSLYLHLGMTGCMLEMDADASLGLCSPRRPGLERIQAWRDKDMDQFFGDFSAVLDRPDVSYSHKWSEGDVVIIDNLAVAHKAAPGAHVSPAEVGLRILHRTTIESTRNHDAPGFPLEMNTAGACPFEDGATWCEGYVGFRWGSWGERTVPH